MLKIAPPPLAVIDGQRPSRLKGLAYYMSENGCKNKHVKMWKIELVNSYFSKHSIANDTDMIQEKRCSPNMVGHSSFGHKNSTYDGPKQ